ncbi:Protein ZNRD2 [Entomophthora muscae]|uniref:Protein ZNRD2 n=1 Tax=Entomophthora muscae TaxID=34485 RepID=A0ACC2RMH1_9FUNG|nr:Protein ZNRD2 [Entomophthora muscae]
MLQGWAMLDTLCPSCPSVPLVRNKEKYSYCVSCNNTFVLESDFDPKLHNLSIDQKPNISTTEPNKIDLKIRDVPVKTKAVLEPTSDSGTAPPRHKHMRKDSSFEPSSLLKTLDESSHVLHLKLSHLNERLAQASDPQQITLLSESIKACIDALTSSLSLKNTFTSL